MSETREILASNGNTSTLDYGVPVNATLAGILQGYISFTMTGDPKRRGLPYWSEYSSNSSVQNMSFVGGVAATDTVTSERCAWSQQALYYQTRLIELVFLI
jgi:hypothetical protein